MVARDGHQVDEVLVIEAGDVGDAFEGLHVRDVAFDH